MVNNAITMATAPAIMNAQALIEVLYAKPSNQFCISNHAIGVAMTIAMNTKRIKSLDNKPTIPVMLEPNTLRTPISFLRWSAVKADKPNNPKQEITMASNAKT